MEDETQSIGDLILEKFGSAPLRTIEIEELGVTLYATPFTLAELDRVQKRAKDNQLDSLAWTWVVKLIREDGSPAFTVKDFGTIRNKLPSDLVARVADQINARWEADQAGNG